MTFRSAFQRIKMIPWLFRDYVLLCASNKSSDNYAGAIEGEAIEIGKMLGHLKSNLRGGQLAELQRGEDSKHKTIGGPFVTAEVLNEAATPEDRSLACERVIDSNRFLLVTMDDEGNSSLTASSSLAPNSPATGFIIAVVGQESQSQFVHAVNRMDLVQAIMNLMDLMDRHGVGINVTELGMLMAVRKMKSLMNENND